VDWTTWRTDKSRSLNLRTCGSVSSWPVRNCSSLRSRENLFMILMRRGQLKQLEQLSGAAVAGACGHFSPLTYGKKGGRGHSTTETPRTFLSDARSSRNNRVRPGFGPSNTFGFQKSGGGVSRHKVVMEHQSCRYLDPINKSRYIHVFNFRILYFHI